MKHKVSDLEGSLLDLAVDRARSVGPNGETDVIHETTLEWSPSTDWTIGGPIIERERITIIAQPDSWSATTESTEGYIDTRLPLDGRYSDLQGCSGPAASPLIAAMRAYVASRFGEEVELP